MIHEACGAGIRLATANPNARQLNFVLEFSGYAWIFLETGDPQTPVATQVATYRPHECSPERQAAWREYLEKTGARVPEIATQEIEQLSVDASAEEDEPPIRRRSPSSAKSKKARQREYMRRWHAQRAQEALAVACPVCEVAAGEQCINLLKKDEMVRMSTVHRARSKALSEVQP